MSHANKPTMNKLLQRKWQDDDTQKHYQRLANIKPITNSFNVNIDDYAFIKNKPKTKQIKEGNSRWFC